MNFLNLGALLLTCVVDVYCIYMLCNSFLEKNKWANQNKLRRNLIVFITVICIFMINILGNGDINLLIVPIVYLLFGRVMYSSKFGNILLCVLMSFLMIFACECLFAILFNVTNETYKNLMDIPFEILCVKLTTYVVFIVVTQILGKKNRKMDTWLFIRYLFIPLSSIGMMVTVFYSRVNEYKGQIEIIMILCFLFTLIGNILVFSAFGKYAEGMYLSMEQKVQLAKQDSDIKYYHQIMKNNEAHYEMIHNTKHYLDVIYQLAKEKQNDSIISVLSELNLQMNDSELIIYSEESHIINLILSEIKIQAEKNGIEFDVYVEPGIVIHMVQDSDLIAMFKNLLENALRASVECKKEPFIKVRIFMQEIGGFCVVKIVNRFSGSLVINDGEFISTKDEDGLHGIGLKSVNKIAEKYGGFLECKVNDDIFEAILMLSTV